jgi:hypothetical protein
VSIVSKVALIAIGWKNFLWQTPQVEAIAKKRAEICAACDHFAVIMNSGAVCDKCLCPIASKVRAPGERCPKGKWEEEKINP